MDKSTALRKKIKDLNVKGRIFDIQKYSIHDGPGIRTLVFLKQCPLRCLWCCNPESQDFHKEIAIYRDKCIKCGSCMEVCQTGAIVVGEDGPKIDRGKCEKCGMCANVCLTEALRLVGRDVTVKEVIDELMKDVAFYRRSGGGVTFSGGEPLMQIDFLEAMLKECKKIGIHTAIETTGYARWEMIERIVPYLDLVLFDIKAMNSEKHRELTSVDNVLILENARKLSRIDKLKMVIRIPFIPGYNDSMEEIKSIFDFAKEIKIKDINILPYHRLGESKYENIGKDYLMKQIETPDDSVFQIYIELGKKMGLNVTLHG